MKIKKYPWVLVILIAGILFSSAPFFLADQPVRLYFFVRWEPLREAALVFPIEEVRAFEKAYQEAVIKNPERVAPFLERYDKTFSAVEEYGLFDSLINLIKPAISRGEVGTVNRFMKAVSDNRWIQGEEVSRNGGPFYVILTLSVSEKNEYLFQHQNRQTVEKEYKGATFIRPLGLSASIYPGSRLTEISLPANLSDLSITLERTMCFGTCPVYSLTLSGDGTVVYEGKDFVKIKGIQKSRVSPQKIAGLLDLFKNADFLHLKDRYDTVDVTDFPSAITSLRIQGDIKRVVHYQGDHSAPKALWDLEDKIDEIANSKQWIQ
jgi:hypothetical protein